MAYRDDRDALHARNEALEAEVAALRAQQHAHEEQLESAKRGLRIEVTPSARSRVHPGALAALVGASAAAFAAVMAVRAARHDDIVAPPPVARSYALVLWEATVKSSSEGAVQPGTPCGIESTLMFEGSGLARTAIAARTVIRCAGYKLYDDTDPRGASAKFVVTHRSVTEDELPLPNYENLEQIFDFALSGTNVPQLTLDTLEGVGVVGDASGMRVELQVKPHSRPQSILSSDRP